MSDSTIPPFATKEEALDWMYEGFERDDERCIDNERFAFLDDSKAVNEYENIKEGGCCGFYDVEIVVDGRPAIMGCNYGH
jgi:hypothetical protein